MDAILLIFAIQLAILLAFLALSLDFSKLSPRVSLRKAQQAVLALCTRSLPFCAKAYLSSDEILPESILETRPEEEKDRPNDSRVILLENKQQSNQATDEEAKAAKEVDIEELAAELAAKPNELLPVEAGPLRLFSRAFCWIFSMRATLFSSKKAYGIAGKNLTSTSPKTLPAIKSARRRGLDYFQCAVRSEAPAFGPSHEKAGGAYSLRYKNDLVSPKTALLFRKKIIKLNFIILKKKKTRPLSVIYEIPEEAY